MKTSSLYSNIALAIVFLTIASAGYTQTIPGRWHKVKLPHPWGSYTIDFNFKDSLTGLSLGVDGTITSTSDGGRHWQADTTLNQYSFSRNTVDGLECTGPQRGIFHGYQGNAIITPGVYIITNPPLSDEVNFGDYVTLAEKMYTPSYGFRLVYLHIVRDTSMDNVRVIITHNGWQSSEIYSYGSITSGLGLSSSGYLVDSNDVWAADGGSKFVHIYHSLNAAHTWDTAFYPLKTYAYAEEFKVRPATKEVFFSLNGMPWDYAYSDDYGKTWKLDSTFGIHLWRFESPAPGILWGMIGQTGRGEQGTELDMLPPGMCDSVWNPDDYSRKLAYSSDNGTTWLIDSTTFENDSLQEMHFLDARHGWVASWSHDSSFMWYYDADGSADVAASPPPPALEELAVHPNPATNMLEIPPGPSGEVELFDIAGRKVLSTLDDGRGITLDISQLAEGNYVVKIGEKTANVAIRR